MSDTHSMPVCAPCASTTDGEASVVRMSAYLLDRSRGTPLTYLSYFPAFFASCLYRRQQNNLALSAGDYEGVRSFESARALLWMIVNDCNGSLRRFRTGKFWCIFLAAMDQEVECLIQGCSSTESIRSLI